MKKQDKKGKNASPKWKIKEEGKGAKEIEVGEERSYFFEEDDLSQNMVKEPEALSYSQVEPMLRFFGYNQKEAASFLEVDPATISRWKKTKNEIGKLRTKNMFEIDEIVAKGIRIFGSEENFKTWLSTKNHALGDNKPVELLKNPYGVEQVSEAINALSWGNFS
jgi:putative toxin-antitoxin system antitoxin component (TIGR02293 family)